MLPYTSSVSSHFFTDRDTKGPTHAEPQEFLQTKRSIKKPYIFHGEPLFREKDSVLLKYYGNL